MTILDGSIIVFTLIILCVILYIRYHRANRQKPGPITVPPKRKRDLTRAVLRGQIAEQIAPILPGFPYNPSDFRFLGQPIDFIVFVGLSETKDNGVYDIQEIVIGDIKTGRARLSPHQEAIRRAVEEGRVRWQTLRVDTHTFTIKGGS